VTSDDYFLLDQIIDSFDPNTGLPYDLTARQGMGGGTSAVPEPSALGALAFAATGLLARRRRQI